jgi:hypothetical protein
MATTTLWHCAVCQTEADPIAFKKLACGHAFHGNCIAEWALRCTGEDASCPTCRRRLGPNFRFPPQWALTRLEQLAFPKKCFVAQCKRQAILMNEGRCELHSEQRADLERVGLMGIANDVAGHALLACRGCGGPSDEESDEKNEKLWYETAADITAKAFLHTKKPLETMESVFSMLPNPFIGDAQETKRAYQKMVWQWPW